jgi:hypothetical protein
MTRARQISASVTVPLITEPSIPGPGRPSADRGDEPLNLMAIDK